MSRLQGPATQISKADFQDSVITILETVGAQRRKSGFETPRALQWLELPPRPGVRPNPISHTHKWRAWGALEGAMSSFKLCAVVVLSSVLAAAAYAAPGRGGPARGGGAAPHVGGGGVPHAMGGGAPHIGGGGPRGGGVPHFTGRPAVSHFAARPQFRSAGRPNFRSAARPGFRGGRTFANHGIPNRGGSRAAALRSSPNRAFSRDRNAATLGQHPRATAISDAVRNALNSRAVGGALHNRTALRNPNARAQIIANAATAGWRGGHGQRNDLARDSLNGGNSD